MLVNFLSTGTTIGTRDHSMLPRATDYVSALQNPRVALTDTDLQQAQFALDSFGLPAAFSGSRAVVFKADIGDNSFALRCYTAQGRGSDRERYTALAHYVTGQQLTEIMPSFSW